MIGPLPAPQLVSVILPTFNEVVRIRAAIDSVRTDPRVEVVVADGGSQDGTVPVARRCADRFVATPRNRAAQLNAGAAAASGSILMFLHADTTLSPGAIAAIRAAIRDEGVVGGAFTLRIGGDSRRLSIISWGTNFRARLLGLPYGDQALFVRADVFRELGGYSALPIMEDVDFVRRLRRCGRMKLIDLPVQTSARRWRDNGVLRTTFANASALIMFELGVSPARIRRYYDSLLAARAIHHEV